MTEMAHNKGYGFGAGVKFGNGEQQNRLGEQQDIVL